MLDGGVCQKFHFWTPVLLDSLDALALLGKVGALFFKKIKEFFRPHPFNDHFPQFPKKPKKRTSVIFMPL
jgi:hypothetical protein